MNKIAFTTFGCKSNQYDTDKLIKISSDLGLKIVSSDDIADIYVINTCTVTHSADRQARNMIRRFIKKHSNSSIIVLGCSSKLWPEMYKDIKGIDYVLGVRPFDEFKKILDRQFKTKKNNAYEKTQDRARAYLKIQDGCDNQCSYCVIPLARGKSKSFELKNIVDEKNNLLSLGFCEIILTGIHIGQYGKDLNPKKKLLDLIYELIKEEKPYKIRISSLDPEELDNKIIELFRHNKICRHLHLSLQSGSKNILKKMTRPDNINLYAGSINSLIKKVPNICIGADIIVGFPSETDKDFEDTLEFVDNLPFSYLHVFPFSLRKNTPACAMQDLVSDKIKKQRTKILQEISYSKKTQFYQNQIGKEVSAVVVSKQKDSKGYIKAISDNYLTLLIKDEKIKYKDMFTCQIKDFFIKNKEIRALGVR